VGLCVPSAKRQSSSTAAILNFERYRAPLTNHSDVVCFIQTPLSPDPIQVRQMGISRKNGPHL
jgi:hypothetical protein